MLYNMNVTCYIAMYLGMSCPSWQLDAVAGHQFEPYPHRRMRLHRWRPCGVTCDSVSEQSWY